MASIKCEYEEVNDTTMKNKKKGINPKTTIPTLLQRVAQGGKAEQLIMAQQDGRWISILMLMEHSTDDEPIGLMLPEMLRQVTHHFNGDISFWYMSLALQIARSPLTFDNVHERFLKTIADKLTPNEMSNFEEAMVIAKIWYTSKKSELENGL